jgi:hypothetical protein
MTNRQTKASRQASQSQREQRIEVIFDLMLRGASRGQLLQFAAKNWGVKTRVVDGYMAAARKWLLEYTEAGKEESFKAMLHRLRRLLAKNWDNPSNPMEVIREMNRLLDLYPAEKSKVEVVTSPIDSMTEEELDKAIEAAERAEAAAREATSGGEGDANRNGE